MISIAVDEHILLRSYLPEDAEELFHTVNNSRKHLQPWLDWVDKTTRPEHSLQFIEQSLHQLDIQEALALGIFYDGQLAGGIGMHQWQQSLKRAQVGYWLSKDFEGKNIAYSSLVEFMQFLFEKVALNKIEIHFAASNQRSAKVASRLGFKVEGVIRQSTIRNGLPEDLIITGLLKNERL